MNYKIAFFSSDWLLEIVQDKQAGIKDFLNDYPDVSIDLFENYGNYNLINPTDSLLELYKLPNIEDYDAIIFQTNSTFYRDYRQKVIDKAYSLNIPIISINDPIDKCIYVGTDNKQAIYDLVKTIRKEKNCKKITFVAGPNTSREANLRKEGFLKAVEGLTEINIIEGSWNVNDGRIASLKILDDLPDLVVCSNDNLAYGVIDVLKNHHVNVGKDVLVTGFDNLSLASAVTPRITTINRDYRTITYNALEIALIAKDNPKLTSFYSPYQIIKGESTNDYVEKQADLKLKYNYLTQTAYSNRFFEATERLEIMFSNINNFYDLLEIFENEFINYGYENVYLIMNSDYVDDLNKDIRIFSNKMYLMGITDRDIKPDNRHIYDIFDKNQVLPIKYKSRYMIYTPLSNNGAGIGYIAFNGHSDLISINFTAIILKQLGLTIESVRKKLVLSNLNQQLEQLYIKDSLTNLYNRFGMERLGIDKYNQLINEYNEASIYFIDMDKMKLINDVYGHEMGDQAIIETAKIIHKVISNNDIGIRYGGDEFIIITNQKDLSEKIQDELIIWNKNKIYPFKLSLSVGKYTSNEDFYQAIKKADSTMYNIKTLSR